GQRFPVITGPTANITKYINIGKEIHLDALHPVTLTRFTASTLDVEREASRFIGTLARLRQHRIELAEWRKQSCIGSGIRSGSSANRRLIDFDHFVDVFKTFQRLVWTRFRQRAIKMTRQSVVKNVFNQCRLSGTRNTGNNCEQS